MTWTAAIMPDDALPPDSLVGTMLNADKVQPEAMAAAMEFMDEYDDDLKALADSERAELPLWRVMEQAHEQEAGCVIDHMGNAVLGEPDWFTRAAEIEALRDHMLPPEPEPTTGSCLDQRRAIWRRDNQIREYLTEQARIARGEP